MLTAAALSSFLRRPGSRIFLRRCGARWQLSKRGPGGAFPPDLFPAAGAHHLRGERAVERRVPFGGDLRFQGCKIVEARQHLLSRAVGAAAPRAGPGRDGRAPAVAPFAAPPDLFLRPGQHIPRRQPAVFLRVPLLCERGIQGRKVVFPEGKLLARADRAAAPYRAGPDRRAPAVTLLAPPPD